LKLQNKIFLISFVVAVVITVVLAFALDSWLGNGFCLLAGLTGMVGGACYLVLGLLLLLLKNKSYTRGLIMCGLLIAAMGFILFKFFPQY
jgi:UDP-N-acetylmuramyl pentapeptide phosphotransferase/UDP-N-acetylglucosamine-1-phosphate transferase